MRRYIIEALAPWTGSDLAAIIAPTWFTFIGLAGVVTAWLMARDARRAHADTGAVLGTLMWCYAAAVMVGIIGPLLGDVVSQLARGGPVRVRWAGMTSFWGYLGALGAAIIAIRRTPTVSLGRFGDLLAAPAGVALVLARLGCLVAGCDYGAVSSLPWAVRFPAGSPAWHAHASAGLLPRAREASLPVHPTQLYEALLGLLIVVCVLSVRRTRWARAVPGRLFLAAAAFYAAGRWFIETYRGDIGRGFLGPLSFGQAFSVLVCLAVAAALWRLRRTGLPACAALVLMLAAGGRTVLAQDQLVEDAVPQPQPPAPTPLQPSPLQPVPRQPTTRPAPLPAAGTGTPAPPAATLYSSPAAARESIVQAGITVGGSAVLNRSARQVPALGGLSIWTLLETRQMRLIGVEFASMGNSVAGHTSLLLTMGTLYPLRSDVAVMPRFDLGPTWLSFVDPAFRDVVGVSFRLSGDVQWRLNDQWRLSARPAGFELLSASGINGAIWSYQLSVGVVYQHGGCEPGLCN